MIEISYENQETSRVTLIIFIYNLCYCIVSFDRSTHIHNMETICRKIVINFQTRANFSHLTNTYFVDRISKHRETVSIRIKENESIKIIATVEPVFRPLY